MSATDSGPGRRRPGGVTNRAVRRRDWLIAAVVAVIAAGLGVYLLVRPAPGGSAEPAPVTDTGPAASAGSGRDATAASAASDTTPTPDAVGPSSTAGPASRPSGDGLAASAVQPPGVTTPQKAGPIGPIGDLARRIDGDPFALGRVDAPVVMVEFADYRCPFCAKFSQTHEPLLIEKYVETGILRIEWRDLPIFGSESERAAVAGRAAAGQGKFWEFNTTLYAAAPPSGHPDLSVAELTDFARRAGLPDIEKFRADLDNPELKAAVAHDAEQGAVLGVPSTPAFVVNGYPMLGAQPIEEFYQLIDTVRSLQ